MRGGERFLWVCWDPKVLCCLVASAGVAMRACPQSTSSPGGGGGTSGCWEKPKQGHWGGGGRGSRRRGAKPSQHSQQLCRGAQSSRKVKPMTLKECKKEEKADREFQKKFKVSRKERSLFPLISPLAVQEDAVQRGCVGQEQAVPSRPPH